MTAHDPGILGALERASQPPTDAEMAEHLGRMSEAACKPVWLPPDHYARLAETPAHFANMRDGLDRGPLPIIPVFLGIVALVVVGAVVWGVW